MSSLWWFGTMMMQVLRDDLQLGGVSTERQKPTRQLLTHSAAVAAAGDAFGEGRPLEDMLGSDVAGAPT